MTTFNGLSFLTAVPSRSRHVGCAGEKIDFHPATLPV
jgi:hypothetical protein